MSGFQAVTVRDASNTAEALVADFSLGTVFLQATLLRGQAFTGVGVAALANRALVDATAICAGTYLSARDKLAVLVVKTRVVATAALNAFIAEGADFAYGTLVISTTAILTDVVVTELS